MLKKLSGNLISKRIHFIAIGGSIMHNLALALHRQGHRVTGSDDVIYGVSRDKLEAEGLMPKSEGWFESNITSDIDLIILGMHAKANNPELLKAQSLGLDIVSFPEYIAQHSKEKRRIVVAGSHGKTTTTSMIMHICKSEGLDFDYLVGAQLSGYDLMVKLSDAPIIIIEGDEYLSSALDRRAKFMHYDPDITIITGIAWDHANVFPTADIYKQQFATYIQQLNGDAVIIYDHTDVDLVDIMDDYYEHSVGYFPLSGNGQLVEYQEESYTMQVFGEHNRKNMHAAILACEQLGITKQKAIKALQTFEGAAMRQQVIKDNSPRVYRDFGHSPSKVKATIASVIENHPNQSIGVVVELHTYSSMHIDFIPQYAGVFDSVEHCTICYDEAAFAIKKMSVLDTKQVIEAIKAPHCQIITNRDHLIAKLKTYSELDVVLVLSSGNLLTVNLNELFS